MPEPFKHAPPMRSTGVTGGVLAGGQGSRMGGIDKGLADWLGVPLALHAARRLAPQVDALRINANRHLATYRSWGWPVDDDEAGAEGSAPRDTVSAASGPAAPPFRGPLAGMRTALRHCTTPLLVTVPCDVPCFPTDLVARMVAAVESSGSAAAVASCVQEGQLRPQPVFALLRVALVRASLDDWLAAGEARVMPWLKRQGAVEVPFDRPTDDPLAFWNVNTPDDMRQLQRAAARA